MSFLVVAAGCGKTAFGTDAAGLGGARIDSVTPEHGGSAGGEPCVIAVSNFDATNGTTAVVFGTARATNVQVADKFTITCDAPPHAAGPVDVVVLNNLAGVAAVREGFTYHDAPAAVSLDPGSGDLAGGIPVVISGHDFSDIGFTTVTFGGTEATEVQVVDDTTIACVVPAHAEGLVDVVVENEFGSGTLGAGFFYYAPIELDSIDPAEGNVAGGGPCTISGENFCASGDTTVLFGDAAASDVVVVDARTITCTLPSHSAGAVNVVVAGATGEDVLPAGFVFHNLESVHPTSGPLEGGTPVTISGSDFTFTEDTTVRFGDLDALNVVVVDENMITCETPAAAGAGAVDVYVANSNGYDTLSGGFTFGDPPAVTSVAPAYGGAAGGTAVTISGSGFADAGAAAVTFGGAAASNVSVLSDTAIACVTPAHAGGAVDVTVTNGSGSGTLPGGFVYYGAPELLSVTPSTGPVEGGTAVVLAGSGFSAPGSTTVKFGGVKASSVVVVSDAMITCVTPPHDAGSVLVRVTNDFGTDTLSHGFTYEEGGAAPPEIAAVSPAYGSTSGGTAVTITGSGFTDTADTSVTFGGAAASNVAVQSPTTITCVTPAHAAGAVNVTVANSNGTDTLSQGFTYFGAPVLTSVAPSSGPVGGGTAVALGGSGFATFGSTTVRFGGAAASNVVVVSSTKITCVTPAHAAGAVNVSVTNDFGASTLPGGFTYEEDDPSILSIDYGTSGNKVFLSWTLSAPGDEILVFRGNDLLATLGGSAQAYTVTEQSFGYFRYTVCLYEDGDRVDQADVLVALGRMAWTPPDQSVAGFYVYVAEAVGDPYEALPYDNPYDFDCDAGWCTQVFLKALYDDGLIEGGLSYYIAVSSYKVDSPQNMVSELAAPLTFSYDVALETP